MYILTFINIDISFVDLIYAESSFIHLLITGTVHCFYHVKLTLICFVR